MKVARPGRLSQLNRSQIQKPADGGFKTVRLGLAALLWNSPLPFRGIELYVDVTDSGALYVDSSLDTVAGWDRYYLKTIIAYGRLNTTFRK